MNTNPYDPPRSDSKPQAIWRSVLLAVALLILMFIGLGLLLTLAWDQTTVAPMIEVEVYDSMSDE